jgi:hypothetical protein
LIDTIKSVEKNYKWIIYRLCFESYQNKYEIINTETADQNILDSDALSHLGTQWGFTDTTPVEGRCVFAHAGILIEELCTSLSQHLNHSRGANIQTLDTIQLRCSLQLRRAL